MNDARTLTEELAARGYSHRKSASNASTAAHDIIDTAGVVVFSGPAHKAWAWLESHEKTP